MVQLLRVCLPRNLCCVHSTRKGISMDITLDPFHHVDHRTYCTADCLHVLVKDRMSHNNKDSVQSIAQNASTPCFLLRPSLHWGPFGELAYIGLLYCYSHPTLTVSYRIRIIKVTCSLRASYYRSACRTRWQTRKRKVNPHLDLSD